MSNAHIHGFRCSVFTGPVLRRDEPELKETGSPIPMHYFKVVVMLVEEEGSLGFTLRAKPTCVAANIAAMRLASSKRSFIDHTFGSASRPVIASAISGITTIDFASIGKWAAAA